METVTELQNKLKQAKEQEKVDGLNKELQEKMSFKGKCYATHTFARVRGAIHASFRRINDVVIKYDKVTFEVENIDYRRTKEGGLMFNVDFSTSQEARNWYESFRYEITPEQYETVKNQVTAKIDGFTELIRSNMKAPSDYITNGDHTDSVTHEELLLASGIPVLKLSKEDKATGHTSIAEMLSWYRHPLFIAGKYLLLNQFSKTILQQIVNDLRRKANAWGSSIADRDIPRANALQSFIDATDWGK